MINWKLEKRKIKDLKPYKKNPRRLSDKEYADLSNSIDKFGLIDRPIVNKNNNIIGGHQRLNVLRKKALKEIECWVPDTNLSEEEIEELNIRLNRNHGTFDFDILANEFDAIDLIQWGFDAEELLGRAEQLDATEPDKPQSDVCEKCEVCGQKLKKKNAKAKK